MGDDPRRFERMPAVSPETLRVLQAQGFTTATPVQFAVIPLFSGNKDVAVDACTGSGKTLAFVVPVVEKLRKLQADDDDGGGSRLAKHQVGAVVISPTRELAKQIHTVAAPFLESVPGLGPAQLLVGGSNPADDVARLRSGGVNVLIGTPGRLDDMLKRCAWLDCRRLEALVLDEADRLLDMGFARQLDAIMARLPKQRRTGLFSATQTEAVEALARAGLRNPVRVNVAVAAAGAKQAQRGANPDKDAGKEEKKRKRGEEEEGGEEEGGEGEAEAGGADGAPATQKTPSTLTLQYIEVANPAAKLPRLVSFLSSHRPHKVIVYFLTCACVEFYRTVLPRLPQLQGLPIKALYGKMKQAARERTLQEFTELQSGVLLATDVAARGLDIPAVTWVVQFDAPQDPDAFVHRVGRTARMGRAGSSLLLLLAHEGTYVEFLRRRKVPLVEAPASLAGDDDGEGEPTTAAAAAAGIPAGAAAVRAANGSSKCGAKGSGKKKGNGSGSGDGAGSGGDGGNGSGSDGGGGGGVLARVRGMAEGEREVMEKGMRAFLAYVRGYREHRCSYIFRLQDLQLGYLATACCLLRMPKVPEVRKALGGKTSIEGFAPSAVDPAAVPFRDRAREKQRQRQRHLRQQQEQQQQQQEAAAAAGKKKGQQQQKASGIGDGDKQQGQEEKHLPAEKRRKIAQRQEAAELEDDYRLLRKLKKGKISERECDEGLFGGLL